MSLTKLTITAYTSDAYTQKAGSAEFMASINPENWKEEYSIKYSASSTQGGLATKLRLDHIESGKLDITLVFDGTGLVSTIPMNLQGLSVADQIQSFKDLTMKPNGTIHEPNYLMLVWGNFSYRGLLTSLTIDYPLISPAGAPLRAKAQASFESSQSVATAAQAAGLSSPDMTHSRKVTSGDTLSQMTYNIYGDSGYYLTVARHNQLDQVRQLPVGIYLDFPPLD
jgi:nucleoid-associated protein YgaU